VYFGRPKKEINRFILMHLGLDKTTAILYTIYATKRPTGAPRERFPMGHPSNHLNGGFSLCPM
jgi:hypothetical protein